MFVRITGDVEDAPGVQHMQFRRVARQVTEPFEVSTSRGSVCLPGSALACEQREVRYTEFQPFFDFGRATTDIFERRGPVFESD